MTGPSIGTSRFAGDDGAPDPALAAALAAHADAAAVAAALVPARLLVPVLAEPAAGEQHGEHGATVSTPLLVGRDGRQALAAFTGLAALAAWRADARPVPVLAPEAATATLDSDADLLVLDVAGPVSYVIAGARLRALAEGRAWQPVHEDPDVRAALAAVLDPHPAVLAWTLAGSADADARVAVELAEGTSAERLQELGARLAEDPVLRVRLDRGLELAVVVDQD